MLHSVVFLSYNYIISLSLTFPISLFCDVYQSIIISVFIDVILVKNSVVIQ